MALVQLVVSEALELGLEDLEEVVVMAEFANRVSGLFLNPRTFRIELEMLTFFRALFTASEISARSVSAFWRCWVLALVCGPSNNSAKLSTDSKLAARRPDRMSVKELSISAI